MAQFPLKMNGTEVCTLEDLKKSFKPDELISYRSRFAAWLKGWDYDEEAGAARALGQNLSDEAWLDEICNIIGLADKWKDIRQSFNEKIKKASEKEICKDVNPSDCQKSQQISQQTSDKQLRVLYNNYIDIPKKLGEYSIFSTSSAFIVKSGCHCFLSQDGKKYSDISSKFHLCEWLTCANDYFISYEKSKIKFSNDGLDWIIVNVEKILNKSSYKAYFYIWDIVYLNNRFIAVWKNENTNYYRFSVSNDLNGDWEEIGSFEAPYPFENISFYDGTYFVQTESDSYYSVDLKKWSRIWDNYLNVASAIKKQLPVGVELKKVDGSYYRLSTSANNVIIKLHGKDCSLFWEERDIFVYNADDSTKTRTILASVDFQIISLFYMNNFLWIAGENGQLPSISGNELRSNLKRINTLN